MRYRILCDSLARKQHRRQNPSDCQDRKSELSCQHGATPSFFDAISPAQWLTPVQFAVLCAITYILFIFGEKFVTYIGASALGVITRMMGLILAVIGTQMVIKGVHGAFGLAG